MMHSVTRRRAIGITAAVAGLSLVPLGGAGRAEASLVTWRGHAMGALASLQIHHTDRRLAERLVQRAVSEVRRLERLLSLYHDDSALVALNRGGVLLAPPEDLVRVLHECKHYWELTGGAYVSLTSDNGSMATPRPLVPFPARGDQAKLEGAAGPAPLRERSTPT